MEKPGQLCDVCIVCALPQEAAAFLEVVKRQCGVTLESRISPRHRHTYRSAVIRNARGEHLSLHISWLARYGPEEMTIHLSHILEEYQPRIVIMTGICAGDAQQVQLGDLVVAERTFTYDSGKFILEDGKRVHQPDTTTYQLNSTILQFLGLFDDWKPLVARLKRPLLSESKLKRRGTRCHLKAMASGSAVRADQPFAEVQAPVRTTVAIDMESAALGLVMGHHPLIPWLVVKGVCDYADQDKNDMYHDYAASAAALYALSFIQSYVNSELLPRSSLPPALPDRGAKSATIWNVPYPRNTYFTGREALLQDLREKFNINNIVPLTYVPNTPQAISGLGGIGKTQTAIEYAYRYRYAYEAVFWIKADTSANIESDFKSIAQLLDLPEKDGKNVVAAVQRWLQDHTNWLLIFDNADDLRGVQDFLPTSDGGNVLLTTRDYAVRAIATPVEINVMENDEGILLLLRRARILKPTASLEDVSDTDRRCAKEIVREMNGLPLALDQVGAYIEETGTSISNYLSLYRERRSSLFKQAGRLSPSKYPHTVATVWSISFEEVNKANPAATKLLRLCAFLDPDAIPEEIIAGGIEMLGPVLGPALEKGGMDEIIRELLRFSLIRRNSDTNTLTIHRLVQAVIRDSMDEEVQHMWAARAIRIIYRAFPDQANDTKTWPQCQKCLPHALVCASLIEQYRLVFPETARLLNQAGYYLRERAQFEDAERLFRQALAVRKRILESEHPETEKNFESLAQSFNSLARLYFDQYKYPEAEILYEQALNDREKVLENASLSVAQALNSLALNYRYEKKYAEAEPLFLRALEIREQKLGPEHPETAHCLNNLALLYKDQGKYAEAEQIFKQVLAIREQLVSREKVPGRVHLDWAQSLQNLAVLYSTVPDAKERNSHKFEEAEQLFKQALAIREQLLPAEHPQIARVLNFLGSFYELQEKNEEAEKCFKRALDIREKVLGVDNPQTIETRKKYDALLRRMGQT